MENDFNLIENLIIAAIFGNLNHRNKPPAIFHAKTEAVLAHAIKYSRLIPFGRTSNLNNYFSIYSAISGVMNFVGENVI